MNLIAFLQSPQAQSLWEAIQTIAPTLTATGVIALLALNWRLRDNVRDLIREVHDKNGLRASRDEHERRIEVLETWKIREDTMTEIEKESMKDVGTHAKRLRDKLHPDLGNV